jgi:ABC-type transporter Mla maintaining outer membrane lipid asymmetry ATPase subunit MlaF
MTGRASFFAPAFALGVEGAEPLAFRGVDLRERPDHPENRFDLVIEPGTITAITGDEDSGVGDIGRFALGFDAPPGGEILVFGAAIATLPYFKLLVFRRRLGYLQVGDGLLQNLSLRANISLPLQYASDHQTKAVEKRVDELIVSFHLFPVADRRPAQVNEEERRRAAIARAVALDPELLILESPFDGLTARASRELLEDVKTRRDDTPRTIVITAQDLTSTVTPLMHRVVRLVDGCAVEGGE